MSNEYEKFNKFLKESKNYKIVCNEIKPNFFSVSGYPHYENVVSNILAFFFDYQKEHNFKDLWIKSLLDCYNKKQGTNYVIDNNREISVPREVFTNDGKRLDIFIESENAIIAIENKIYSGVDNPFDLYHKYATQKSSGGNLSIIEILLTLKAEKDYKDLKSGYCFINITYKELFDMIKKNRECYTEGKKGKWAFFMDEFIDNITDLQEAGEVMVNGDWQKFLCDNQKSITEFIENFNNDIQTKKRIFQKEAGELKDKLKDKNFDVSDNDIGIYGMQGNSYFSIFINCKNKEHNLAIEVYSILKSYKDRSFNKYYIDIWNRNPSKKTWQKTAIFNKIKKQLNDKKLNCAETDDFGWGMVLMIDEEKTNWIDFDKEKFEKTLINTYSIVYEALKETENIANIGGNNNEMGN